MFQADLTKLHKFIDQPQKQTKLENQVLLDHLRERLENIRELILLLGHQVNHLLKKMRMLQRLPKFTKKTGFKKKNDTSEKLLI